MFTMIGSLVVKSDQAKACHAIALVNTSLAPVAGGINANASSDSPTCGCATYWLDVEVRCLNDPFNSGPFNPGFWGPLNTYPFFQSAQMNKPNCVVQPYPSVFIPYTGLCPGVTYKVRMRENHNGQVGPWSAQLNFTVPGSTAPLGLTTSASNNNVCAGTCVNLSSTIANGCNQVVTYSWTNGAGTNPTATVCPNVTTTYTLSATEACSGFTATSSVTITVLPLPVAGTASVNVPSVCSGQTVNLTLTGSSGVVQWQSAPSSAGPWTNVAGATATTMTSGALTANTCFRAQVTGCGPAVFSNAVCVTVNPIPTVTINNPTICDGNSATLTPTVNPTGGTYSWAPGGQTTSTITVNPSATTTYTLTYTAMGCPATATGTVTVNPIPTVSVNNEVICSSSSATLTATVAPAGGTYVWSPGGQTTQSITVSPATTTTYTVTYTLNGCTQTGSGTVTIGSNPTVTVTSATICAGQTATIDATPSLAGGTFSWAPGGQTTQSISVSPAATTTYTVTYNNNGCIGTGSGTVTVNPVPTVAVNNQTVCNGTAATLTATPSIGGGTFLWNTSDVTSSITQTPSATTTYSVTYDLNGCTATGSGTITVNPVPTVTVNNAAACSGNNATLTATPDITGGTFLWSPTGDVTASITYSPAATTTYTVTYTLSGCTATGSGTITVIANPVADFSPNSVCQGTNTVFTDLSSAGVTGWSWDFGDGSPIETIENPIHNYPTAGTYNATLTVDFSGCTATITKPVVVNPIPTAAFNIAPACPNSNSSFTDASFVAAPGTITNYDWTLTGSSSSTSTLQNPAVSYPAGGNYTVTLVVTTDAGCLDTLTQTAIIPYMPVPDFSFVPVCLGDATCFTDLSTVTNATITGWTWVWGDSQPVGTTANPCHTYATAGSFAVTLIPTTSDGCTGPSVTQNVDVFTLPVASFTVNTPCEATAATFNNTSTGGVNFNWDFGDGNTSVLQNPTHTYPANTYNVTLIVSSGNGCADTVTNPVTIYPMPVAAFTAANVCDEQTMNFNDASTVSSGTITTWNWDFGDAATSAIQNPGHLYAADNNYNVTLTVTTNNGCQDAVTQAVTVYPLPVVAFTPTDVCLGVPTQFQNLSTVSSGTITNYAWDFNDSGTSTATNPAHTYAAEGTYSVVLGATTNNGCFADETVPVTVHPNPVVTFASDITSSCNPLCVTFVNTSNISSGTIDDFVWDFGDGNTSTANAPSHCYINTTHNSISYTVTLTATSDFGCVTTTTINNMLVNHPIPVAEFVFGPQPTTILNPTINFTNTSINGSTFDWQFGDGGTSTQMNPSHMFPDVGTYNTVLNITSANGCTATVNYDVVIGPEFLIYVPNTFTPDGDGINDIFIPVVQGHDPLSYELFIFDRWGALLFQTDVDTKGWDGTNKTGGQAKEDVYVWKVVVKDAVHGELKEFHGHVNILR